MDNEGLEQLAKWFFMPPMKRYLVSIGRRGVASMDHDTQVNSCIVELAERTDISIAELQNMDVSNLMQVAAKESTKYVPYIPAEANDAPRSTSPSCCEIRTRSRFKHTAVNTLSNGHIGYIPTRAAFERSGGYETKLLSSSHLAADAGEMLVKRVGDLLDEASVDV